MTNIGSYFEIPVSDLPRAMGFYSAVFECDFHQGNLHGNEMAFFPFRDGASGITGALAKGKTYQPSTSGTLIYFSTPDADRTLAKVIANGGEVLFPKTEVPQYGWAAEFQDCEGNRVGLFQRSAS